jgi:hypothetical protein
MADRSLTRSALQALKARIAVLGEAGEAWKVRYHHEKQRSLALEVRIEQLEREKLQLLQSLEAQRLHPQLPPLEQRDALRKHLNSLIKDIDRSLQLLSD